MTIERSNEWNADAYDSDHSFVYESADDMVTLLNPDPTESVLDLGCGTGQLTHRIESSANRVVGTDSALDMITQAKENFPELSFVRSDARTLPFDHSFDAVFSNAVLHWINDDDQDEVIGQVKQVLNSEGRFVAEFGGSGNVSRVIEGVKTALANRDINVENPWYFPSVSEYTTRLERQGFEVRAVRLFDRPTRLDGEDEGLRRWLKLFGDHFFTDLSSEERDAVIADIEENLHGDLYDGDAWVADYRRLRFVAVVDPRV
jgi:trans-aconitate methyltransferase